MLGGGHVTEDYGVCFYFFIADNHGSGDIEGVCLPKLGFEALAADSFYYPDAIPPQCGGYLYRFFPGFITNGGDEDPGTRQRRDGYILFLEIKNYPLYTHGEAESRGRLAAQLFNQVVVTSTATEGALGFFFFGLYLKNRPGVIVKAPDQAVVYLKGYFKQMQVAL